ncbi:MAG TPA: FKBP-type peptidyl-prolyl cis-trans isomerase, partial [Chitinophagaceae bacterium]|nr:FKBP-type peptidyl-prolyl cis-trans isomerase [Chitinophagaceae bacterium]
RHMKKTIFLLILSAPATTAMLAQQKTVAKKPVDKAVAAKPKTVTAAPVLKNTQDSLSYAIGLSVANFYKQQGIKNITTAIVTKAINDVNKNAKPLLDEMQAQMCIMNYMQKVKAEKAAPNKQAGAAFLAANKNNPGVVTLPSGLQYQVLKEGAGPKPTISDKVKCHYHGTLIDGTVFDSSVERGQPIELSVGGVIPGWIEALQLMPVGSKWKLFIPSNLAYGDQETGSIKAGSTLIFEVELLDIVK